MFRSLTREDIHRIIDVELKKVFERIEKIGYEIDLSEAAKDYIAEKGFDIQFGARPLKRAIQKYLEDPLAEEIIQAKLEEGDKVVIDYDKEKDEITVKAVKSKGGSKKKSSGGSSSKGGKQDETEPENEAGESK